MSKRTIYILTLSIILCAVVFLDHNRTQPALAQDNITINSANFACDVASVTYTVLADDPGPVSIKIFRFDDTEIGSAVGSGNAGTHSVSITYSTVQSAGTELFASINASNGGANTSNTPCSGTTVIPPAPTQTGTPVVTATTDTVKVNPGVAPPQWPGFSDGRLNPDPTEPYSVYCSATTLSVYSSANASGPVAQFNLAGIAGVIAPDSVTVGGVTFQRQGDVAGVSGTNNNFAPQFRTKSFTWSACYTSTRPVSTSTRPRVVGTFIGITPTVTPTATATPIFEPRPTEDFDIDYGAFLDYVISLCTSVVLVTVLPAGSVIFRKRRIKSRLKS